MRDVKTPFAKLGLGFRIGVTKTMLHTEAQHPAQLHVHIVFTSQASGEGAKGRAPCNDYSNFLVKSLFLSEPDWRASSSRGMDGQTPHLITA